MWTVIRHIRRQVNPYGAGLGILTAVLLVFMALAVTAVTILKAFGWVFATMNTVTTTHTDAVVGGLGAVALVVTLGSWAVIDSESTPDPGTDAIALIGGVGSLVAFIGSGIVGHAVSLDTPLGGIVALVLLGVLLAVHLAFYVVTGVLLFSYSGLLGTAIGGFAELASPMHFARKSRSWKIGSKNSPSFAPARPTTPDHSRDNYPIAAPRSTRNRVPSRRRA